MAVGASSQALGINTTSLGFGAGYNNLVNGTTNIGANVGVDGTGVYSTSIGAGISAGTAAAAFGARSIAIGGGDGTIVNRVLQAGAFSGGVQSVAIGTASTVNALATNGLALGYNSNVASTAPNAVALGSNSVANIANTVSIGAVGAERRLVNLGAGTIANNSTDGVNGGQLFTANQRVANAFGGGAGLDGNGQLTAPTYTIQGTNFNSVGGAFTAVDNVITANNSSGAGLATMVGMNTTNIATNTSNIATNTSNIASNSADIANIYSNGTTYFRSNSTGPAASATGTNANAIGSGSSASGSNSLAFGSGAQATQSGSIAVGFGAASTGTNAIAIGTNAVATGSVAVGSGASAANGGAAFGDGAVATATNATAVGPGSSATAANSVAIGSGSTNTAANTVSVGSAGNERRVTNVAAGTNATDAVNVSQLQTVASGFQSQIGGLQGQITDNMFEMRSGVALALAASGLRYDDRPGKLSVAGAFGGYKGASGLAFGLGYAATDRLRFNASISGSPSQGNYGGVVGGSMTLN